MSIPTKPQLIIHFMRHAEAEHKIIGAVPDTSLRDPELSDKGQKDSRSFSRSKSNVPSITHILCSPMRRTILTAAYAFSSRVLGPNNMTIVSLPELQNLDSAPNGQGWDFKELIREYEGSDRSLKNMPWIDISTFGREGWNKKKEGIWSSTQVQWRVDYVKGFLKGMWAVSNRKGMEVVVVSHGSFLGELVDGIIIPNNLQLLSYVFDEDGGFQKVGVEELRQLRELATKKAEV